MKQKLVQAKDLKVYYPIRQGLLKRVVSYIRAVDGVSLELHHGEIVSLVGESGCGKSSFGRALLGLETAYSGKIIFNGEKLDMNRRSSFQKFRRDFQIIFQDPYSSLNPRHSVFDILAEPLLYYKSVTRKHAKEKVVQLLEKVGLSSEQMYRYPHAFSGGQRQRLCIARVISLQPKLIVCDEIVSALDLSVQAQIVQLLLELKKELGIALLWISHDLSLVRNISDRVNVMYLGKIVESRSCQELFENPSHPYTKALLAAIPTLDQKKRPVVLKGEPPSSSEIISACAFSNRCPKVKERCLKEIPPLEKVDSKNNEAVVACFFPYQRAR